MKRTLILIITIFMLTFAGAVMAQDVETGDGEAITPSYVVMAEFELAEIRAAEDGLYTITFSGATDTIDAILVEPEFGYEPLVSQFVYTVFSSMDNVNFEQVVVTTEDMKLTFTLSNPQTGMEPGIISYTAELTDVQADGVDMAKFKLPPVLEGINMYWTLDSDFTAAYREAITEAGLRSGNGSNGF